jgi:hypothetical protein
LARWNLPAAAVCREIGKAIHRSYRGPILEEDVLAHHIPQLSQPVAEPPCAPPATGIPSSTMATRGALESSLSRHATRARRAYSIS